ncbi:unnamed protein product [Clavelina lepadiformis]|uniref:Uncharacterized protein n=1 Tax=Clavelina lepadiformis TaxID=159417 RepID=A0ABP0F581_CLALP
MKPAVGRKALKRRAHNDASPRSMSSNIALANSLAEDTNYASSCDSGAAAVPFREFYRNRQTNIPTPVKHYYQSHTSPLTPVE